MEFSRFYIFATSPLLLSQYMRPHTTFYLSVFIAEFLSLPMLGDVKKNYSLNIAQSKWKEK